MFGIFVIVFDAVTVKFGQGHRKCYLRLKLREYKRDVKFDIYPF